MQREAIVPPGAPVLAPYSPAVAAGRLVFVSGQVSVGDDGELATDDFESQARRVYGGLRTLLEQAGCTMADVCHEVQGAPACETVKLSPAMLMTPVRESDVGLAGTLKLTLPLLELFRLERIVSHGFVFTTLQVQPTKVVTATELVDEPKVNATLFEASANVQSAPDCETVKLCPATVTTPLRASAVGLAWTL